jgi:hypothetical protein
MPTLRVHLPPRWSDVTADNPEGGPTYVCDSHGLANPLQVSYALYRGGPLPNPSEADLIALAEGVRQAFEQTELLKTASGPCDFGHLGTVVFRSPEFPHVQSWCLSNGRDFIRATHICEISPEPDEVQAAEWIVHKLTLITSGGEKSERA